LVVPDRKAIKDKIANLANNIDSVFVNQIEKHKNISRNSPGNWNKSIPDISYNNILNNSMN